MPILGQMALLKRLFCSRLRSLPSRQRRSAASVAGGRQQHGFRHARQGGDPDGRRYRRDSLSAQCRRALPPASVTKLMTAEVVFQAIKDGRLKLTDEFPMSVHAWRTGGAPSRTSSMFVPVNTTATLDELLQGMIVQSGNDAAIAIAEGMAGTEEAFAKRMNVEAHRIGLTKSVFKNPSGPL